MSKKTLAAALLGTAFAAFAANKANDPVIMNIAGQDVKLSEFEYLFNKNNSQQQQPVTFDEYVDMFVDYKLKVADALACGIDTTRKFQNEFSKFRTDLALPYLIDKPTEDKLVQDAYNRMLREVKVSHIMYPRNNAPGEDNASRLDSLRQEILKGNITFEDAAMQYSIDKPSAVRGGLMGWITSGGRVPYRFEEASYSTPTGEISEVVNSGVGFHIVRVEDSRPNRGEVRASHILLLTRGMDENAKAAVKERIDSIRAIVNPGNFAQVAESLSQDPGSARKGGDLGWFGSGRMVAEFDSAAFALAKGQISEPIESQFGWHIIFKTDVRNQEVAPLDSLRSKILDSFSNDPRHMRPVEATLDKLAEDTKSAMNANIKVDIANFLSSKGLTVCDSTMNAALKDCNIVAYNLGKEKFTVASLLDTRNLPDGMELNVVPMELENRALNAYHRGLREMAQDQLYATNSEYHNLYNEYRDGIMLFEISNQKVWDRATKDTEGLEAFFKAHSGDYTWPQPKFKAYVIFATTDSVLAEAKKFTDTLDPKTVTNESLTAQLKEKFGKNVKVERVIAAKGENAITDFLGFGAEYPANTVNNRWKNFYAFGGRIIDKPEEAIDVRGLVISDYQAELEKQWVEELHKKFKVKINQKALKKASEQR